MFLSESARLCECDGPGLVPNPEELKQRDDQEISISNWSLGYLFSLASLKHKSFSLLKHITMNIFFSYHFGT